MPSEVASIVSANATVRMSPPNIAVQPPYFDVNMLMEEKKPTTVPSTAMTW
jgi:hypothetical protein